MADCSLSISRFEFRVFVSDLVSFFMLLNKKFCQISAYGVGSSVCNKHVAAI